MKQWKTTFSLQNVQPISSGLGYVMNRHSNKKKESYYKGFLFRLNHSQVRVLREEFKCLNLDIYFNLNHQLSEITPLVLADKT